MASYTDKLKPISSGFAAKLKPIIPKTAQPFDVPATPSPNKLGSLRLAATNAENEAKAAGSFGGMAKNFGAAVVKNLVPSEVGLGGSLQKIFGNQGAAMTRASGDITDVQIKLLREIKAKESRGEDTTALKRLYNDNQTQIKNIGGDAKRESELPSTAKVAGQLAGTALDVLSVGTYGKAASSLKTGQLGKATPSVLFRDQATKTATETAGRHVASGQQIVDNLPNAPVNEVINRVKVNLVDGLRGEGQKKAAEIISKLDPTSFATVEDYGKAATEALKKGLGQKFFSLKTLGELGLGGGIGYGYDVSLGLQGERGADREGSDAFIPGIGTAIGAGVPLLGRSAPAVKRTTGEVVSGVEKVRSGEYLDNQIRENVGNLLTQTKGIQTKVREAQKKNVDLNGILSDQQVYAGLKVENKKVNPDEAIAVLDDRIDKLLTAKQAILPELDRFVPKTKREVLRARAKANVADTVTPADEQAILDAIDKQINALPDELTLEELDKFRAQSRKSSRNARGMQKGDSEYAALENAARDIVFEATDNLPIDANKEFPALNNYVKNMIETKTFLDKTLRGQVVSSGRLGTYVARGIGALAGSSGGVLGTIAGSEVGGLIANILTNNQLGSSLKFKLVKNLTNDPAILSEVEQFLKKVKDYRPPLLPGRKPGAPSSSVTGGEPLPLPQKTTTSQEAEEISRIQEQIKPPQE